MKNKEKRFELIEQYLQGKLDPHTLQKFRVELKNDPHLANEVNLHRELAKAIMESDVDQFRKNVDRIIKTRESPLFESKKLWFGLAASVLVLFVIGVVLFWIRSHQSEEELFQSYFQPYNDVLTTRSETSIDQKIYLGMAYYRDSEYDLAIQVLEEIESDTQGGELISFYLGICYLASGSTSQAIETLDKLSQNEMLKEQSQWYKALALIRDGQRSKAREILVRISQAQTLYSNQAQNLIDQL